MIISARKVTARKRHLCDGDYCGYHGCSGFIEPGEIYYRLYGAADRSDPPYVIKLSNVCCRESLAVRAALLRSAV